MASITIRKLDDSLKTRLRIRAAEHGHSMEEEARAILKSTLEPETLNLFDAIRRHFEPLGGMELAIPPREPIRERDLFGE